MNGELEPMPLADVLGGIGYRTAMGVWPPGFDEAHALLTMVNVTERLRLALSAHHAISDGYTPGEPCPICVGSQGAKVEDVLTDMKIPAHVTSLRPLDGGMILAHCLCGWEEFANSEPGAQTLIERHLENVKGDPRGD